MDSMDVNKVIAAVLVAGIAFSVAGMIGRGLVEERELKQSAIKIEGAPSKAASTASKPAAPTVPPIGPLLASASAEAGEKDTQKLCTVCHSFNQGGAAKVGPNLYGIVGDKRAHAEGFNYSDGLAKLGGTWTYDALNDWLYEPKSVVPGTRMAFAGIKNDKDRADVIAYLRSLSASPLPLPAADAAPAKPEAAPAKPEAAPAKN